ncbi:synaptic vesicle glycoprotein 2C-like [Diadema antillarum]|uniref:synaptic vesicle glycoprotein 2C-like n=1 Tax=Diadema antillarum TaxID=105358 RepID=UPI003A8C11E7
MSSNRTGEAVYTRLTEDSDDAVEISTPDTRSGNVGNYSAAVDAAGFGRFHAMLLLVCGWANMSDTVEILSVSFLLPQASRDMHITNTEKGVLNSIIFVGMLVGGYCWGSLADVQGRRQVLMYSLACNALFGFLSSLCQQFPVFLMMRFLSGVGVGGSIPVIFSYFGEFQPSDRRGAMISALATFWMFGNILTAALAWAVIPRQHLGFHSPEGFSYESWRIFIALCCIPAASSVLTFLVMPESPKYLLEKGKSEEALQIMRKIQRWNNPTRNQDDYPINHLVASSKEEKMVMSSNGRSAATGWCGRIRVIIETTSQLFKGPQIRVTAAMLTITFCLSFGFYGLWMWFPEIFNRVEHAGSACGDYNPDSPESLANDTDDNIYRDGFYTSLSNLPGNLLTIFLMDRLGRKFMLTTSLILSGVSVFLIWFLQTRTQVLATSIVFGAISVVSWNTLSVMGVEMYPTNCRTTALGVQSVVNRTAAILGNLLFGVLIELHCSVPMILIAAMLAAGGLVTVLLPNTTRIELK